METFKTQCPGCSRRLKAPESAIGQKIRCPSCGYKFVLEPVGPPPLLPSRAPLASGAPSSPFERFPIVFVALALGFVGISGAVLWVVAQPGSGESVQQEQPVSVVPVADIFPEPEPSPVVAPPPDLPAPSNLDTVDASTEESPPTHSEPAAAPPAVAKANLPTAPPAAEPVVDGKDPVERALQSVLLVKTGDGLGTGFVYHAPNLVITNFHVIAGAKDATAVFFDGSKSEVLGFRLVSQAYDFAVLEIATPHKDAVPLKACEKLPARGTDVYALGSPQGLAGTVTKGIISAYRTWPEIVKTLSGGDKEDEPAFAADSHWVQTSAPISSGNSGGPLITPAGEVVAINTWVLTTGQNLNFSLDFARVVKAVNESLDDRKPLAALPKARAGFGGHVSDEEKAAVKVFWESLSKTLSTLRRDLEDGPPLIEGQAGVQAFQTRAEWNQEVFRTTSASLEQLPTENIPEPVLRFALAIASRMRRVNSKVASILAQNEKRTDYRSAASLARDIESLQQSAREIDVLINELAPKMKRELEKVIGAELPPIMGSDDL